MEKEQKRFLQFANHLQGFEGNRGECGLVAGYRVVGEAAKQLQTLARHQMIEQLLHDILKDMVICKYEGWDVYEYIEQIEKEISLLPHRPD